MPYRFNQRVEVKVIRGNFLIRYDEASVVMDCGGVIAVAYKHRFDRTGLFEIVRVPSYHLRPAPPQVVYELKERDMVDAFLDNSWFPGRLLRIQGPSYTVDIDAADRSNCLKVLPHNRVRLSMEHSADQWTFVTRHV